MPFIKHILVNVVFSIKIGITHSFPKRPVSIKYILSIINSFFYEILKI